MWQMALEMSVKKQIAFLVQSVTLFWFSTIVEK
jgi:hypothetical protein